MIAWSRGSPYDDVTYQQHSSDVVGAGSYGGYADQHQQPYDEGSHEPVHYSFHYDVHDPHTGDVKSQHETRTGDVVTGFYTMVEPDGTVRTVKYKADKHSGFNAVVDRKKPAEYAAAAAAGHY